MGVKLLLVEMMMLVMLQFRQGSFAQITNRPGCEERCGSLVVPYPFGIGPNCSASKAMEIYCNTSSNPPKAFSSRLHYSDSYTRKNLEVVNISVEAGTIHINYPISTDCTSTSNHTPNVYLDWPFTFSNTENRFTAMGCDNLALLTSRSSSDQLIYLNETSGVGGCVSRCDPSQRRDNTCFGIDCCQTQFPPSLWAVQPSLSSLGRDNSSCSEGSRKGIWSYQHNHGYPCSTMFQLIQSTRDFPTQSNSVISCSPGT